MRITPCLQAILSVRKHENGKVGYAKSIEKLITGDGNDSAYMDNGNNNINLGKGNNTARLWGGNDTLAIEEGNSDLDGGEGQDTFVYTGSGKLDIDLERTDSELMIDPNADKTSAAYTSSLTNFENIVGTKRWDTIYGDDKDNYYQWWRYS